MELPLSIHGNVNHGFYFGSEHIGTNNNERDKDDNRGHGDIIVHADVTGPPDSNTNITATRYDVATRRDDVSSGDNTQTRSSRGSSDNITWVSTDDEIVMVPGSTLTRKDKVNVFHDFVSWQNRMEREYQEKQSMWFRIWNDKCVLITSYFIGVMMFIVFFHIDVLPKLPFPVINNLADWDSDVVPYIWWIQGPILVEIMWGFTHIRRTFFIVLSSARIPAGTTHSGRRVLVQEHHKRNSCMLQSCLGACALIYHVVFGVWLGWANNIFCGYQISDWEFVIAGLITFSVAEIIITIGDIYFICKKVHETTIFRKFRLAAEIFVWAGFGLVSMTLPAVFVFVGRFGLLAFFLYIPERPSCSCSS